MTEIGKTKILVVEDESIVALHVAKSLESMGYKVTATVPSGEKALESVKQERPDLAFMDIVLKEGMSGIDVAKKMYWDYDVPIIFLTAYSDKTTLERAKKVGSFGYLLKPFQEKDLHGTIQVALEKHRKEKELRNRAQTYSSTLQHLGQALIITDNNGDISFFNSAAQDLTGLKENSMVGKSLAGLIPSGLKGGKTSDSVLKVLKDGKSRILKNLIVSGKKQSGEQISVDARVIPLGHSKCGILGAMIIISNPAKSKEDERRKDEDSGLPVAGQESNALETSLINLCPWCKKIYNEQYQRWETIEAYFEGTIKGKISHCICPECAQELGVLDMLKKPEKESRPSPAEE